MKHWYLIFPCFLYACDVANVAAPLSGSSSTAPLVAPMSVSLDTSIAEAGTSVGIGSSGGPVGSYAGSATTVASVGDPVEPGQWMETPLVTAKARARVTVPNTGASTLLELRPSGATPGSGSQLSLEAMRALGLSLTDLTEVEVTAPI